MHARNFRDNVLQPNVQRAVIPRRWPMDMSWVPPLTLVEQGGGYQPTHVLDLEFASSAFRSRSSPRKPFRTGVRVVIRSGREFASSTFRSGGSPRQPVGGTERASPAFRAGDVGALDITVVSDRGVGVWGGGEMFAQSSAYSKRFRWETLALLTPL